MAVVVAVAVKGRSRRGLLPLQICEATTPGPSTTPPSHSAPSPHHHHPLACVSRAAAYQRPSLSPSASPQERRVSNRYAKQSPADYPRDTGELCVGCAVHTTGYPCLTSALQVPGSIRASQVIRSSQAWCTFRPLPLPLPRPSFPRPPSASIGEYLHGLASRWREGLTPASCSVFKERRAKIEVTWLLQG